MESFARGSGDELYTAWLVRSVGTTLVVEGEEQTCTE